MFCNNWFFIVMQNTTRHGETTRLFLYCRHPWEVAQMVSGTETEAGMQRSPYSQTKEAATQTGSTKDFTNKHLIYRPQNRRADVGELLHPRLLCDYNQRDYIILLYIEIMSRWDGTTNVLQHAWLRQDWQLWHDQRRGTQP